MTSSKDKRNTEYFYTQMHLFIFLDKPPIVDDEEIAPFNLGEDSTVDLKHLDRMFSIPFKDTFLLYLVMDMTLCFVYF